MAYNAQTQVPFKKTIVPTPEFAYVLSVGERITFKFQENLGTGYSWVVVNNNENVAKLITRERIDSDTPGVPDSLKLTFEAQGYGMSEIVFELRRPWEKNVCPAARFFVFIHVK